MKVSNPIPGEKISDYVDRILVIEEALVTNPFTLPLYANGAPTLLFQTAKGLNAMISFAVHVPGSRAGDDRALKISATDCKNVYCRLLKNAYR
jgi:hypothetical protein